MTNRVFTPLHTPLILIVDDAPEQRLVITRILEQEHYRTIQAGSGRDALAVFDQHHPDVVILDLHMPQMNGIEVCREIKQRPGGEDTPILMLTAASEDNFIDEAFDAGVADYLTKPVSLSVLRHRLKRIVAAQHNTRLSHLLIRAIAATNNGLCITDARKSDNPIIYVNPAFEAMTGYTTTEVIGQNCRFLQGPQSDPAAIAAMREAIRTEQPTKVELINYRKDGSPFWNELAISPVYDEAGRLINFVGIQNDVTERRRFQNILQQAKHEWETTVDTVAELIYLTNSAGNIVRCNHPAAERLGFNVRSIVGQRLHPLLFPQGELTPAFKSGESETLYLPHLEAWFTVTRYALKRDGRRYGTVYSLSDVTQRIRAEKQVSQTERLAALGRLAAILAHEIKNPLQAIQIQLDLVIDYPLSAEDRQRYLERTRDEIERLSEISQRVLNFARPAKVPRHPVAIPDLVKQTLALVHKQLEVNKLRLETHFSDVPMLTAAPDQLTQVFLNLILNAIEAAPKGGTLRVGVAQRGDTLAVTFINDGPPIPPHHLPHVFDPFFTTKEQGGGMGLSISHSIITDHCGTLSAENLPNGAGVAFTVRLPLQAAPELVRNESIGHRT